MMCRKDSLELYFGLEPLLRSSLIPPVLKEYSHHLPNVKQFFSDRRLLRIGSITAGKGITMELAKILLITLLACLSPTEGSYFEDGNFLEAAPFHQQAPDHHQYGYGYGYRYQEIPLPNNPPQHKNQQNQPKQVPAVVPVSPVFQVELMKAMAQLEEKKSVTLYVVPQNSLEVVPHSQQKQSENLRVPRLFQNYQGTLQLTNPVFPVGPNHIPAVEVPLEKPLIINSAKAEVFAPAGFTVLVDGPRGSPLAYPFTTGILLAPVPVGTIISADTPVVLTTLYAVPSLPALPSAVKILANFVQSDSRGTKIATVTQSASHIPAIHPVAPPPRHPVFINRAPLSIHHLGSPIYPISPGQGDIVSLPASSGPTVAPVQVGDRLKDEFGSNVPANTGFVNSKESPFLLQLREDSLKRQIKELQDQLTRLQQASSPVVSY